MSTSKYRTFGWFLVFWAVFVLAHWMWVQAWYDPHGGFSGGDVWAMLKHPYKYVIPNTRDVVKGYHHLYDVSHPYWFGLDAFVFPAISLGIFGLPVAFRYGGFKSSIGRAIAFFSIGTVTWGFGAVVWFWYNTRGATAPYPSAADYGYLSILPLAGIALWNLIRALAVPLRGLVVFVVLLALAGVLTYVAVHQGAHHELLLPHKTVTERLTSYTYVTSDIVLLAMSVTLLVYSRRAAGGTYLPPMVAYASAFLALYLADMVFFPRVYSDPVTYYNGDLSDLLYIAALLLITVGTFLFARAEQKTLEQMREFEATMMASSTPAEGGA